MIDVITQQIVDKISGNIKTEQRNVAYKDLILNLKITYYLTERVYTVIKSFQPIVI